MPVQKKRKKLLAAILFGFILLFVFTAPAVKKTITANREGALLTALIKSAGAEVQEVNVTGWVKVEAKPGQPGPPVEMVRKVADSMGLISMDSGAEVWENAYAGGARLAGALPDGSKVVILGQLMNFSQGQENTHIMINLTAAELTKTKTYKKMVAESLQRYGADSHVAVTLSGRINAALDGSEMAERAETMLHSAGADVQERTNQDNLISITGYSERLKNNMNYAGKEVNMNIALRRNQAEGYTMVYVATPVILIEY
ncbi:MAG: YwmB family TATA-box binding protein [Desulfotomaculaceae bacterium]|nr:YwmB family TATA-box binding protein [Desulfotomaculaceae bacterium]